MKIKALIRHCYHENRPVVYYKQKGKFYKMVAPNSVQPLSYQSVNQMLKGWNNKAIAVLPNEQVLFNGKPVELNSDTVEIHGNKVNV